MARLEWNDAYATGIVALDYEHGLLLDTVNMTCDRLHDAATHEDLAEGLALLYERVCAHFALEESLMHDAKYALYAVHKAEHERLVDAMRDMMDAYDDGVCEHCNQTLDECLLVWFDQHFRTTDSQLRSMAR